MNVASRQLQRELRNVILHGRRTSLKLETFYWRALDAMSVEMGMTINELVTFAGKKYDHWHLIDGASLSSVLRVFVAEHYRVTAGARDEWMRAEARSPHPAARSITGGVRLG